MSGEYSEPEMIQMFSHSITVAHENTNVKQTKTVLKRQESVPTKNFVPTDFIGFIAAASYGRRI